MSKKQITGRGESAAEKYPGYREDMEAIRDYAVAKVSGYNPDPEEGWEKLRSAIYRKKRSRILRILIPSAAAVVAGLLVFIPARIVFDPIIHMETVYANDSKKDITMPDGSVVKLNANTILSYSDGFGTEHRNVKVEGEAFFTVEKSDVPFVVDAGEISVSVIGTVFNVRSYPALSGPEITLLTGSVSVDMNGSSEKLSPGEKCTYDAATGRFMVVAADVVYETIWARDFLRFENRSLADICRYLEKWYGVTIELSDKLPPHYHYTLTLTDESPQELLRLMSLINPFAYTIETDLITIN